MSRTTVQRWRARFATTGCDGLQDRPRRGRPSVLAPTTRALVVALACERPADRGLPLSRYSLGELAAEAANVLATPPPSRSSIWRWLMQDALRPWRHHCWIFPRDPHFLDEISWRRGQRYLTLVVDHVTGRLDSGELLLDGIAAEARPGLVALCAPGRLPVFAVGARQRVCWRQQPIAKSAAPGPPGRPG